MKVVSRRYTLHWFTEVYVIASRYPHTRILSTWMGRAGANATLNTSQGPNKLNEKFVKLKNAI